MAELESAGRELRIFSQDNPDFPTGVSAVGDDRDLEQSWRLNIETVPTAILVV